MSCWSASEVFAPKIKVLFGVFFLLFSIQVRCSEGRSEVFVILRDGAGSTRYCISREGGGEGVSGHAAPKKEEKSHSHPCWRETCLLP